MTTKEQSSEQGGVTIEQGLPAEEQPRMEEALPKKKQSDDAPSVPWWKRPAVWIGIFALVAIGLIVGLSVGLTNREARDTADEGDPGPETNTTVEQDPPPLTPKITLQAIGADSLTPYPDCQALQDDLEAAALYLANSKIDSSARSYYHNEWRPDECIDCFFDGTVGDASPDAGGDEDVGALPPTLAPGSAPTEGGASAPEGEDSFQTNVQVEGVDEADFVKSDGEHVFAIYGNEVVVWDADTVAMQSRTTIVPDFNVTGPVEYDEFGNVYGDEFDCHSSLRGMLLYEDRLVVIATGGCYFYGYEWEDQHSGSIIRSNDGTYVRVFDVSTIPLDGKSPLTQVDESFIQGQYLSARSIESRVHIITSGYLNPYRAFTKFLDRYNFDLYPYDLSEYDFRLQAQAKAEELHQDFARNLLTELKDATNDDTCRNLLRLSLFQSGVDAEEQLEFTGNGILGGLTFVTSFDLSNDEDLSVETASTSAMFSPNSYMTVYSSADRLVLAGQGWNGNEQREWREETFLITYELVGASATPIAVSHVPGYLLNQFSLDHLNKDGKDFLRVATTNSAVWGLGQGREWTQTTESSSQVIVLEETEDESMTMVGMVDDIGRGERIYSVRFLGDRAFVVTFRQTDPFFTIDISDVTNPVIAGELKIPGFSNYLHPIGDGNQILAVGQNADEETGRTLGLQISLFDVSDFSDPQRIQFYTETSDSFSNAQYDHRAFRYLPETQVLILPVEVYDWPAYFDGFVVYNVTEEEIAPRFRIEHADADAIEFGCWGYSHFPGARSLVFGGVAMTMKTHTVLLHDLDTTEPLGSLNMDADVVDCDGWYW